MPLVEIVEDIEASLVPLVEIDEDTAAAGARWVVWTSLVDCACLQRGLMETLQKLRP
jgi:hypothetical protein